MRKILFVLALGMVAACYMGCESKPETKTEPVHSAGKEVAAKKKQEVKDVAKEMKASASPGSIVFWTRDDVLRANPSLVMLLDTLFQHRGDSIDPPDEEEMPWVNEYRKQLCAYYDRHHMGDASVSEYAKVDTVLDAIKRLYKQSEDLSSMGVATLNGIFSYVDLYREFNILAQLLECSEDDTTKKLLFQERKVYDKMFEKTGELIGCIATLECWGGSAPFLITSIKKDNMSQARVKMYGKVLKILKNQTDDLYERIYPDYAARLLLDCAAKRRQEVTDSDLMHDKYYREVIRDADKSIAELRPLVRQWISIWNKLGEEFNDNTYHDMQGNEAAMLITWTNIVCTG